MLLTLAVFLVVAPTAFAVGFIYLTIKQATQRRRFWRLVSKG